MKRTVRVRGEAGDSLVEILVAVAILSILLVVLVSALSTGVFGVRASNRLTSATNLATSQLESIKASEYITGATATSYALISSAPYTISYTTSYYSSTCSCFTSTPADDSGMQWITVTVSHQGETLAEVSNYKVNR
ncbi:MAG: hypothetical protein ACE5OS_03075 [Anaerolineae bacterium]